MIEQEWPSLQSRNRSEEWATPVFIFFALAQSGKFLFPDSTVPSLLHATVWWQVS